MSLIDQIDAASVPSGSGGIWFLGQASVVLRTERWTTTGGASLLAR